MNQLKKLIGTQLKYGIKSPDLDLFQLGFERTASNCIQNNSRDGSVKFAIHFTTALYVYWQDKSAIEFYSEDDCANEYHTTIQKLIGSEVRDVALSEKNDFWISFDSCNIVIVTSDDIHESWRFFQARASSKHIIGTKYSISLE